MATSTVSSAHIASSTSDVRTSTITARPHVSLTTIYTPPPSCSSIVTWDGTNLWQFGTNQTGGDCYPPQFLSLFNSYYSPGICPDQWTSAGSIQTFTDHDALCCPKGFFLSGLPHGFECASVFYHGLDNVYSTTTAGNAKITSGASLTTFGAYNARTFVVADVIQVQWQATDRNIISLMSEQASETETRQAAQTSTRQTTSVAVPTAVAKVSSSSGGASTTDVASIPKSSTSSASGLSTGAKIAIGVSIPVIVLALLGVVSYLFLRRRKGRVTGVKGDDHRKPSRHEQNQPMSFDSKEKTTRELPGQMPPELDAQSPQGSGATSRELWAGEPVAEIGRGRLQ